MNQQQTSINSKFAVERAFFCCRCENVYYQEGTDLSLGSVYPPAEGRCRGPASPLNDGDIKHSPSLVALLSSFTSRWSSRRPALINHQRGLQLFASLWPRFQQPGSYKLSVNSVGRKKRPLQAPFVTVCWQMLLGCLSQTHASLPPSAPLHQMACFAFSHGSPWAALSPQLLEAQRHTGSCARSRLWPASILTNVIFSALPPPLWLWLFFFLEGEKK